METPDYQANLMKIKFQAVAKQSEVPVTLAALMSRLLQEPRVAVARLPLEALHRSTLKKDHSSPPKRRRRSSSSPREEISSKRRRKIEQRFEALFGSETPPPPDQSAQISSNSRDSKPVIMETVPTRLKIKFDESISEEDDDIIFVGEESLSSSNCNDTIKRKYLKPCPKSRKRANIEKNLTIVGNKRKEIYENKSNVSVKNANKRKPTSEENRVRNYCNEEKKLKRLSDPNCKRKKNSKSVTSYYFKKGNVKKGFQDKRTDVSKIKNKTIIKNHFKASNRCLEESHESTRHWEVQTNGQTKLSFICKTNNDGNVHTGLVNMHSLNTYVQASNEDNMEESGLDVTNEGTDEINQVLHISDGDLTSCNREITIQFNAHDNTIAIKQDINKEIGLKNKISNKKPEEVSAKSNHTKDCLNDSLNMVVKSKLIEYKSRNIENFADLNPVNKHNKLTAAVAAKETTLQQNFAFGNKTLTKENNAENQADGTELASRIIVLPTSSDNFETVKREMLQISGKPEQSPENVMISNIKAEPVSEKINNTKDCHNVPLDRVIKSEIADHIFPTDENFAESSNTVIKHNTEKSFQQNYTSVKNILKVENYAEYQVDGSESSIIVLPIPSENIESVERDMTQLSGNCEDIHPKITLKPIAFLMDQSTSRSLVSEDSTDQNNLIKSHIDKLSDITEAQSLKGFADTNSKMSQSDTESIPQHKLIEPSSKNQSGEIITTENKQRMNKLAMLIVFFMNQMQTIMQSVAEADKCPDQMVVKELKNAAWKRLEERKIFFLKSVLPVFDQNYMQNISFMEHLRNTTKKLVEKQFLEKFDHNLYTQIVAEMYSAVLAYKTPSVVYQEINTNNNLTTKNVCSNVIENYTSSRKGVQELNCTANSVNPINLARISVLHTDRQTVTNPVWEVQDQENLQYHSHDIKQQSQVQHRIRLTPRYDEALQVGRNTVIARSNIREKPNGLENESVISKEITPNALNNIMGSAIARNFQSQHNVNAQQYGHTNPNSNWHSYSSLKEQNTEVRNPIELSQSITRSFDPSTQPYSNVSFHPSASISAQQYEPHVHNRVSNLQYENTQHIMSNAPTANLPYQNYQSPIDIRNVNSKSQRIMSNAPTANLPYQKYQSPTDTRNVNSQSQRIMSNAPTANLPYQNYQSPIDIRNVNSQSQRIMSNAPTANLPYQKYQSPTDTRNVNSQSQRIMSNAPTANLPYQKYQPPIDTRTVNSQSAYQAFMNNNTTNQQNKTLAQHLQRNHSTQWNQRQDEANLQYPYPSMNMYQGNPYIAQVGVPVPQSSNDQIRSSSRDSGIMSPSTPVVSPVFEPVIACIESLHPDTLDIEYPKGQCNVCKAVTILKCTKCYKEYYCSYRCQKLDWDRSHRSICK